MKRYGDNLPSANKLEDETDMQHHGSVQVMYGGCGVRFGTFTQPVKPVQKRKMLNILSLLGFRRKKSKENTK